VGWGGGARSRPLHSSVWGGSWQLKRCPLTTGLPTAASSQEPAAPQGKMRPMSEPAVVTACLQGEKEAAEPPGGTACDPRRSPEGEGAHRGGAGGARLAPGRAPSREGGRGERAPGVPRPAWPRGAARRRCPGSTHRCGRGRMRSRSSCCLQLPRLAAPEVSNRCRARLRVRRLTSCRRMADRPHAPVHSPRTRRVSSHASFPRPGAGTPGLPAPASPPARAT
jgi:hypothetical protein